MRDQSLWDRTLEVIRTSGQRRDRSAELQRISADLIARTRERIAQSRKVLARIARTSRDLDD